MKKIHIATYQRDIHRGIAVAEHLKKDLADPGKSVVIRLGGTMPYDKYEIQINSAEAVKNSIDKEKQKELLIAGGVPVMTTLKFEKYPCVVKGKVRSGGLKVFVANNKEEFDAAVAKLQGEPYYREELFTATSEYRLHCTRKEVFFAVKKIKNDKADILINRNNHINTREFLKPRLWEQMKAHCLKAMAALDLDIACFDILYSSLGGHSYVFCEANTNPELLLNTYNAYVKALDGIIAEKAAYKPAVIPNAGKDLEEEYKVAEKQMQKLTAKQRVAAAELLFEGNYSFDGENVVIKIK